MFWGAAHALTPGHGKAMVAAYLVGTRGKPRHAFMLGGTVTAAHTAGVFAIGFVTLALSQFIVPEQLYPWLTLASGLLVVAVGIGVLRQRLRARHGDDHHHHDHDHDGTTTTATSHHHHHHDDDALTSKGILGVGIAAGLLPCPSALVVLLSAIALHRVGLGLALIVAFSVGLAATITAIGLVAVLARRAFGRLSLDGPVVRALPAVSAALILAVGVVITAQGASRRPLSRAEPVRRDRRTRDMFGLDDWIAGLSDGASVGVVLFVAVLLGLRHATDPDHIAAMTTLVASGRDRAARARRAARRLVGRRPRA